MFSILYSAPVSTMSRTTILIVIHPPFRVYFILVPRGRDPSGFRQESRPMAPPNFWACAEYSFCVFRPIRFVTFDNESVNRGLPVLETARGLDSWRRPEGSRPLGTRMGLPRCKNLWYFSLFWSYCFPSLSLFCQLFVVLFVLCSTSPVSFKGSYSEDEPQFLLLK